MKHSTICDIELFKRKEYSTLSLFPKQREALFLLCDNVTKTLYYGGGAGGGKSWLGCEWLFNMCVSYPEIRAFIGREELKRIRQSTLITWSKVCKSKGAVKDVDYKINLQDNYILFSNGSQIDLLDVRYLPSDPLYERFGSIEYTIGWLEETGETHFDAYDTLRSRVGRHKNEEYNICPTILNTLNPKKNWCYAYGYKPFKENRLPLDTKFIQALYSDNPKLDKAYVENLHNIVDKAKKQRLLFGNWEYDDDPTWLIESYDKLTDLVSNVYEKKRKKYITVDVARLGDDKARIGVWDDWSLIEIFTIDKCSIDVLVKELEKLRRKYNVPKSQCVADEDGVGGGVIDYWKCKGFVNNSTCIKIKNYDNFRNLKSQSGFYLATKINKNEVSISENISTDDLTLLYEELEQLKRKEESDDSKQSIISKDTIKQNIGRSPDLLDMMLMRSYFDLYLLLKPSISINYNA